MLTILTQTTSKALHTTINISTITKNSARGSCHNVLTVVELPDVFAHIRATDTGMALDVHVVTQSKKNL